MDTLPFLKGVELTELHTHLGFSVSPQNLWELAHNRGMKLPTKDYWEFEKLVTFHERKDYEEYLMLYDLTEKIQSNPDALFNAAQTAISGAYRKNNITKLELRFNPILRNRRREKDLDHLIVYTLQGIQRAMLKYPVKAGLILMMDRRLTHKANQVIVEKAIKYKHLGVIGIDLAGPVERTKRSQKFECTKLTDLFDMAREAELGITVHTGEATNVDEMWEVVEELKPDRIGHGIASVKDPKLMKVLKERNIVLETCPSSNLNTKLVKDYREMKKIYNSFKKHGAPFTINTDGPEMQLISLKTEYEKLYKHKILNKEEILQANKIASEASFIK